MRTAAVLFLGLITATPAMAQAPWESQQPLPPTATPGVPYPGYVPGSPYARPGYAPGAPYGYRGEALRRREFETERRREPAPGRASGHTASHDPFAADQVGAAPTKTIASSGASTGVVRGRAKGSASGAAAPSAASTGTTPCKACRK